MVSKYEITCINPTRYYQSINNFYKIIRNLCNNKEPGTGHPRDAEFKNENEWNQVLFFDDKYIVKIAVGLNHTLFLEENGIIWAAGFVIGTAAYRLGSVNEDDYEKVYTPKAIPYFEDNIKIIDIAAGAFHNLAVDVNCKVYSWGGNKYGQCGHGVKSLNVLPKLIEELKDYQANTIRCGQYHSYISSECGKHYLFGANTGYACLVFDKDCGKVTRPYRIDPVINKKCKGKLVDVYLGEWNSVFIVSMS